MPSLYLQGVKVLSRTLISQAGRGQPPEPPPAPPVEGSTRAKPKQPVARAPSSPHPQMPTTAETIAELHLRLRKELYRMQMDLLGGGRIAGKPCDCLQKHPLGIEATIEELIPMDNLPIYHKILAWLKDHEVEFLVEEVAKRPPEYYKGLSPHLRDFRKAVMGTEAVKAGEKPPEEGVEL